MLQESQLKLKEISVGWQSQSLEGNVWAQSCPTLYNSWTVAHQTLLSLGFPRQEYWSRLLFTTPPALAGSRWLLTNVPPEKPLLEEKVGIKQELWVEGTVQISLSCTHGQAGNAQPKIHNYNFLSSSSSSHYSTLEYIKYVLYSKELSMISLILKIVLKKIHYFISKLRPG